MSIKRGLKENNYSYFVMSSLLSVLMVSTKVKQNIVKTHSIKYTHQELKINSLSEPQSHFFLTIQKINNEK